jgi:hypothetical protein
VSCSSNVAWCCCNTTINGARTCACSSTAECKDKDAVAPYISCVDP